LVVLTVKVSADAGADSARNAAIAIASVNPCLHASPALTSAHDTPVAGEIGATCGRS
jgi:hypothetical protein